MTSDPLYKDIIEGLKGQIDANKFEECVVDLIRGQDGYFAVPILGGRDGGMDGAVADGQGKPYPIVSTTRKKDVIGNVTDNLKKYVDTGGERRECIIAASKSLTRDERDNIEDRVDELGFVPIQILDQAGIAQRLCHDPKWCKELLHLKGNPSVLSVVPRTRRPLSDHELIGRKKACNWLKRTQGDRLLVGELGIGKTSLLYQFAKDEETGALFVVDKNRTDIANAIRKLQPKVLMVDDAHTDPEFLLTMKYIRDEIDREISLVATCWTGEQDNIQSILNVSSHNVHELDRLSRDQMVCVLEKVGLKHNYRLIQEIVEQANGLPGIAGTLGYLAFQGDWKKIHTADALSSTILRFYEDRLGDLVRGVMASFALGGSSGMSKHTVATQLEIPPLKLQRITDTLVKGGIMVAIPNVPDNIKIRPAALRHAVIRDVFFSGAASVQQPVRDNLLKETPDPKATAMALIRTRARGGKFEAGFLESYIAQLEDNLWHGYQQALAAWSPEARETFGVTRSVFLAQQNIHHVWGAFAAQGYDDASWVIENFTGRIALLAPPLLHRVPQSTIPKLLTEAVGDNRALNAHPNHPLRLLQDWVQSAYPATSETVRRRGTLLRGARKWTENRGDPATGYKAMLFAMIPHYEDTVPKPGSGNAFTWQEAYLTTPELQSLQPLWMEVIECTSVIPVPDWQVFLDIIEDWVNPFRSQSMPEEARKLMTSFAIQMVLDVKEAAANHIGVLHRLKRFTKRLSPDLDIIKHDVLDTLYPIRNFESDLKAQEKNWVRVAEELALSWINLEPHEIIAELESVEQGITQQWPRLTPYLCQCLAQNTLEPLMWFNAALPTALPPDTIMPFLREAIRRDADGWKLALRDGFETERLRESTLWDILTCENVPGDLVQVAFDVAGQHIHVIESLVRSNRLSRELVTELFKHPDKALVGKLAIAEWKCEETGTIADDIRTLWEQAVIEHCEGDYWLKEIFKVEAELAVRWFKQRVVDDSYRPSYEFRSDLGDVFTEWSLEDRRNLLDILPYGYAFNEIIVKVIGDKVPLYERLLQKSWPDSVLLAPLNRSIDSAWKSFAKLAHERGHAPEEIVSSTFISEWGFSGWWAGRESDRWKDWRDQFDAIRDREDDDIRRIAEIGYQRSNECYKDELDKERDDDVYGRDWD